jgi:hypothetical protein
VLIPDLFDGDALNPDDPNLWDKFPAWLGKDPVVGACTLGDKVMSAVTEHYNPFQVSASRLSFSF